MLCKYGKRKLQLADYQLTAILRSCLGRIRTLTGGTRIRRATITPQGNLFISTCFRARLPYRLLITDAKVQTFLNSPKFYGNFFKNIFQMLFKKTTAEVASEVRRRDKKCATKVLLMFCHSSAGIPVKTFPHQIFQDV